MGFYENLSKTLSARDLFSSLYTHSGRFVKPPAKNYRFRVKKCEIPLDKARFCCYSISVKTKQACPGPPHPPLPQTGLHAASLPPRSFLPGRRRAGKQVSDSAAVRFLFLLSTFRFHSLEVRALSAAWNIRSMKKFATRKSA